MFIASNVGDMPETVITYIGFKGVVGHVRACDARAWRCRLWLMQALRRLAWEPSRPCTSRARCRRTTGRGGARAAGGRSLIE